MWRNGFVGVVFARTLTNRVSHNRRHNDQQNQPADSAKNSERGGDLTAYHDNRVGELPPVLEEASGEPVGNFDCDLSQVSRPNLVSSSR